MAIADFNWRCPHCDSFQTVTDSRYYADHRHQFVGKVKFKSIGIKTAAIACSNPECEMLTVHITIAQDKSDGYGGFDLVRDGEVLFSQRVLPDSLAKPQPVYIPSALREDYVEACKIRDISPKASATLSRRCLQGMIRDFCGVSAGTLFNDIARLREMVGEGNAPRGVSIESVEAIDQVRGVGNIGAHMEKDINHIVPVDPDEAQLLIGLIELLFDEWYVARHNREKRLAQVRDLAEDKRRLIADLRQSSTQTDPS